MDTRVGRDRRVVRQGAKTPPRSDSVLKGDGFSISRLERCDDSLGRVVVESYCPCRAFRLFFFFFHKFSTNYRNTGWWFVIVLLGFTDGPSNAHDAPNYRARRNCISVTSATNEPPLSLWTWI